MTALCAGSFDPITIGHYSYICRVAAMFDKVVVCVSANTDKSYMFNAEERLLYVQQAFAHMPNVKVVAHGGWLADMVKEHGADFIVKGLRDGNDFDYENTLACVNRSISGVETLFIPTLPEHGFISSTAVREMIKHGKDYTPYIPKNVCINLRRF